MYCIVLYCVRVCVCHSHCRLRPSAGRRPGGNKNARRLFPVHPTPSPPGETQHGSVGLNVSLRFFKNNLKINNEVFYLQVRNTLCYLVLGLQDEAVVNFGEAVAGGNRQNLWEKHRCQTTNHRQACVSGNSSAYSTHTPPRTPSWRPCCLLATGGRRPGRSSD